MWETFWNSSFWLGGRWTWEDFEDKEDGVRHPHLDDLYMSIPLTGLLILFKTLIQRFIFLPIGVWYGMENRAIGLSHDPSSKKILDDSKVFGHTKDSNGNKGQMDNRLRQSRSSVPLNILDKFTNLGWKFFYKSVCVAFEVYYLWNKEWLWNIEQCWNGYPHQDVDNSLKWYYCFQLAFFMAEIVLQINDPTRKDFLIMAIHHVCAFSSVGLSWVTNQVRIIVLAMFAHDIGDVVLQFGKMLLHMKYFVVAKYYLIPMVIAWISARNVFYFKILTVYKAYIDEFGLRGAYYLEFSFGCTLFCLDVIWTIALLKIILRTVTTGRVENSQHVD